MPRLNIEDSIFRDDRFMDLVALTGCRYKALGMLTGCWMLAQETWLKHRMIPADRWRDDMDPVIQCGLATRAPCGGTIVRGAEKQFAWLDQRSEAGSTMTDKRREHLAKARAAKSSIRDAENSIRKPEKSKRDLNGSIPLTLTPTLTLTLNTNNNTNTSTKPVAEASPVRMAYREAYKNRYGLDPTWAAKENSLAKQLVARVGIAEAERLARNYPGYPDPWHTKQKHPFALLVSQLDKVRVELADPRRMLDHKRVETQIAEAVKVVDRAAVDADLDRKIAAARQRTAELLASGLNKWQAEEIVNREIADERNRIR